MILFLPEKVTDKKMCENTFFKMPEICLSEFKYVAKYSEHTYNTTHYS